MRKIYVLMSRMTLAAALHFPLPSHTQVIQCPSESATKDGTVKIGDKTLTLWKTGLDKDITSNGSGQWSNPTDNWLYGEYWPLYKDERGKSSQDAKLFVKSNPKQPSLTQKVCWDAGADGDKPYHKRDTVGYYAFDYQAKKGAGVEGVQGDLDLEFLCVKPGQRGGGIGTQLINLAVGDKTSGLLSDKQSLRLRLVAHKKAEGFYNKLVMSCQEEDYAGQTRNLYTATLAKGEEAERRPILWYEDCEEVVFGCTNSSDYDDAVNRGIIFEGKSCEGRTNSTKIDFSAIPLD